MTFNEREFDWLNEDKGDCEIEKSEEDGRCSFIMMGDRKEDFDEENEENEENEDSAEIDVSVL